MSNTTRKKISVKEYINKAFEPGSGPSELTVRRWLENGDLPGEKIGGRWFVYVDDAPLHPLTQQVLAGGTGA